MQILQVRRAPPPHHTTPGSALDRPLRLGLRDEPAAPQFSPGLPTGAFRVLTAAYQRSSQAAQRVSEGSHLLHQLQDIRREAERLERQVGGGAGARDPQLTALSRRMASLPDLTPTINKVTRGNGAPLPRSLCSSQSCPSCCHTFPTRAVCPCPTPPTHPDLWPLTVCSAVAKETSFWCLVAMEMSGSLFLGCGTGAVAEEPWVPSLTSPSLHSSVGAPGRRPVPQEHAPESCVPETTARHVALTAEGPSPELGGPSGRRARWPGSCRVSTPSSSRPGRWWVQPRWGGHTGGKAKEIESL